MRKHSIVFVFLLIAFIMATCSLYASRTANHKLRLISMNEGQAELIDDAGLKHNMSVSSKGVCIDTMTYCNGVPFSDVSQYVVAYDSMLNWFLPVANCSLYEVHGMFASGGTARVFACRYGYSSSDSSHPWPVIANELPSLVLWSVSGTGAWEEKDFKDYPEGYVLQFPGDSLFGVGYRSDNEARPHIYYDDYSQHPAIYPDPETGDYDYYAHWRFTYQHDGHWYFLYYYQPGTVPEPRWCPELNMRVVVNYYEGVPPFVEFTEQKSDTWLKGNIKITAVMSDLDGWIPQATLHYTERGLGDTAKVSMILTETKESRYSATGYLPGPFSVGDTICYWCTCVDNDGNFSKWTGDTGDEIKSFVIKKPQNPGAQILLVGDESVDDRARYYEEILDSLGYSYEPTWFAERSKGIDNSVVLHTHEGEAWETIIWFGMGCGNMPRPDTLESESEYPVIRYLNNGGKLLLADQDYFWKKGLPSGVEVSFEPGDFAYDYLGVQSCISDPNVDDTISLGDTTFFAVAEDDPVSGDFYYDPVELHPTCVGVANWADYTEATPQGVDIFLGASSGSNSGTRFPSAKGFQTVFLPWCFEAIVDCADTSALTAQADTLMWNILHDWFEIPPKEQGYDRLWVQDTKASVGQRGKVISVFGENCSELSGYSVCMKFDPDVIEVDTLTLANTRGEEAAVFMPGWTDTTAKAGVVYVYSCPGISPGEGLLLKLVVNIKDDAPLGPTTLELVDVPPALNRFSPCEGETIAPTLVNGTLEVVREMFVRGDDDVDGALTISDPILSLCYQFVDCPPPSCMDACDVDDDGEITISDPIRNLCYQFADCDLPPAPFPNCGPDPTEDGLDCVSYPPCGTKGLVSGKKQTFARRGKIEVGKVCVSMDGKVALPVYLTNTQALTGFAYTIRYDNSVLTAISAQDSGLVTEGFDFFSAKINNEKGWIKVGNVVSYGMSNSLPAGTYQVARVIFNLDVGGMKDNVTLELVDGQFVDMETKLTKPELTSGVIKAGTGLPKVFNLSQNYPNPFNPVTEISYQLPRLAKVTICIYNTMGQLVRILINEEQATGFRAVRWNGKDDSGGDVSSGIYFCQMRADGFIKTRKMVLLR